MYNWTKDEIIETLQHSCCSVSLGSLPHEKINEYVNRGIFYENNFKNPFFGFDGFKEPASKVTQKKTFKSYCLHINYSNELKKYAKDSINEVVAYHEKLQSESLIRRAELNSFDKKSKIKFFKSALKIYSNKLDNIEILVDNYEVVYSSIVDYFGAEAIVEFVETRKINEFKKNELIQDTVEVLTILKLIEIIKERIKELKTSKEPEKTKNPHPRIFINETAYKLFENLKETVENEHADYSFIFRIMQRDEYIYPDISESAFRNWIGKHYSVTLLKLKTYEYCYTRAKENLYKTTKSNFKDNLKHD